MKPVIIAAAVLFAPSYAYAGCADYQDDLENAPKILACYGDACDVTVLLYECANAFTSQAGYEIGWSVWCEAAEGTCRISWQDREIDPSKHHLISFTSIDD